MSETRKLFEHGDLIIYGTVGADPDGSPDDQDFENAEQERDFKLRFILGRWIFTELTVTVKWSGVEIGTSSLCGVEHGMVAKGIKADAWDITPAQRPNSSTVIMGSPMSGVVCDAIDNARQWLSTLPVEGIEGDAAKALNAAARWADPNRPEVTA